MTNLLVNLSTHPLVNFKNPMDIFLVRHTRVDVPPGTCYGWTDVPLCDTFPQEATQTQQELAPQGPFDAVFSSPLTRARRLAAFCGYTHPIVDHRLKEMHMGDWEMRRFEDIDDENLQRWYADYMNVSTTNGEGFPQFYARVTAFLDHLRQQPFRRVAIFSHGGVLLCAGIYAGLFSTQHAFEHLAPFGGILHIQLSPYSEESL